MDRTVKLKKPTILMTWGHINFNLYKMRCGAQQLEDMDNIDKGNIHEMVRNGGELLITSSRTGANMNIEPLIVYYTKLWKN